MDTNHYHQNRILVNYVFMKLYDKIEDLNMEDLTLFFDETGWYMHDMVNMIRNIQNWIKEKRIKQQKNFIRWKNLFKCRIIKLFIKLKDEQLIA
jgi:hypothetical protein